MYTHTELATLPASELEHFLHHEVMRNMSLEDRSLVLSGDPLPSDVHASIKVTGARELYDLLRKRRSAGGM